MIDLQNVKLKDASKKKKEKQTDIAEKSNTKDESSGVSLQAVQEVRCVDIPPFSSKDLAVLLSRYFPTLLW